MLDEYFESAGALEAMGAGSGDFFTLSQRPGAALLLRDDSALNGADDDVFAPPNSQAATDAADLQGTLYHTHWGIYELHTQDATQFPYKIYKAKSRLV